jgi:membrane protein DedA with SNARE-associated domain
MLFGECNRKDRMTLTYVLTASCFMCIAVVTSVGIIVGAAMNSPHVPETVTLAFQGYAFGSEEQNVFHMILERVIVCLPGLMVLFGGPLIGSSLADNLKQVNPRIPLTVYRFGVWVIPCAIAVVLQSF